MGLRCASCGHDNDPTRVYCHNCGTKLDRAAVVATPPTGFTHPTDVLKKGRRPTAGRGGLVGALAKLVILAALAAAVVLALLPPPDVPPPVVADEGLSARLNGLLDDASAATEPRAFALPAAEINRWLVSSVALRAIDAPLKLRPQRLYAVPGRGDLRVGLELALPGAGRIFLEGDYVPVRGPGGYTLRPRRYSIGRLPLPVLLGWPVQRQMDGLAGALAGPLEQFARASHIGIEPEAVALRWSDSAP
jgi:hypothetical protein